eukprot:TRINITY_DN14715_c0_g1_i1.p1 TRINITY_DN14715_c0_g1~~TRINITY_DN14715_c0_g1_i1.p1  ORF type:complete len:441 (+),score=65.07 TRINITY_DN14715_c0_g1_i1:296-1618(+)
MSRCLLDQFRIFSPKTNPKSFSYLSTEQVAKIEQDFLDLIRKLLLKSNFSPLSDEAFKFALQEDYLNTLPIDIIWDGLDAGLFQSYRELNADKEQSLTMDMAASFNDKIWIFSRGVGLDRTTDLFLYQKLDLLIIRMLDSVLQLFTKKSAVNTDSGQKKRKVSSTPQNLIKRVTLFKSISFREQGLTCLLQNSTLQEPTFQEVVIIYRRTARPSVDLTDESLSINPKAIYVKTFTDIPMADLELIFPEKKVKLRPLDMLWFSFTAIFGVFTILFNLIDGDEEFSSLQIASFVGFVMLGLKCFTDYRANMIYYQSVMLKSLYERSTDNHDGVILFLMEELKQQELKEIVLAYFFLLKYGEQTAEELDVCCEQFLFDIQPKQTKGSGPIHIDFEVKDALEKLQGMNLCTKLHNKVQAVSLDVALASVHKLWNESLEENNILI